MAASTSRRALIAQGAYYVTTGVLPLLSRRLFERITGPKLEWWLVETVAGLVTTVGAGLLSAGVRGRETPELVSIAAGSAAALATIDVAYVARRRISPVYLGDAAVELALLGWLLRSR